MINSIQFHIRDGFDYKKMSESMSELEQVRMKLILDYFKTHSSISSVVAAELLDVQTKTAARLLTKAETIGLLDSDGKTRNKVYMLNCNREEGM